MTSYASAAKRSNLGDKAVAIEQRPFPVVEMGSFRIPATQHDAVVLRALQREVADRAIVLAHDRQEEAFSHFPRRRHLDDITLVIAKAAGRDRNAARQRHHLLHTELEVAADQRHRGKKEALRRIGTGQRAQGQICLFEGRDTHDAMGKSLMPALLLARQRWYGRSCAHEPLSLQRRMNAAPAQSIMMPSSRTTRPNFSRSRLRNTNASWLGAGSTPCAPREARTCGSASATAVSRRSSSTMLVGIPLGPSSTVQLSRSKSVMPASLKVGTFGSALERASPTRPIALTRPASIAPLAAETPP